MSLPFYGSTEEITMELGEVRKFLLEREDKPEKGEGGGGVDVEMGSCHFFITLQFNHIYSVCGKSKVSFITSKFSSNSL